MLIRIQDVASMQVLVASEMAKFSTNPAIFLTAGENVASNPGYLKTSGKENQWYEAYGFQATDARAGNHDFYCWSKFFFDQTAGDPRLQLLAYQNGGSYKGVPFGDGS